MTFRSTASGILLVCLTLAGCVDRPSAGESLTEICRPATVQPAQFGVGDLVVPRDQIVARLQHTSITDEYGISIRLTEQYSGAVAQMTRESLGQPLPLLLDNEVIAEPVVITPILDGRILISGNYTRTAASDIVARLSGPCPPDSRD
ncbi:MAG: hypothetical protein AAFQ22_01605 [Pseudomonadota bacterium]